MSELRIGKVGRKWFKLPAELAVETTAVVGRRGQGKTSTGVVVVEELADTGVQIVVIDPTDVWYGLKSSLDGKRPGLQFLVLGGPHGDLPIEAGGGRVIADFVVDNRVPVVLSLRHLRKNAQRQIVTDFAEQLYHRKGEAENRTPLLVVIDEASAFVPQRVMGDAARMVGAIEDLVRRGRAAGIGVLLIDQRPASVNKDVLTQLSTLVCHQITAPQDRKALDEWIRQHDSEERRDDFNAKLASLDRGEAWFWAPGLDVFESVKVRQRETFDSSKTPAMGEEAVGPETVAELDLEDLATQLEATVEQAKASDPKELKRKLAAAEAEIRKLKAETPAPDPEAIAVAEDRGAAAASAEMAERLKGVRGQAVIVVNAAAEIVDAGKAIGAAASKISELCTNGVGGGTSSGRQRERARPPAPAASARREQSRGAARPAPTDIDLGDVKISDPQQRILDTLAQLEQCGIDVIDRAALAALAGASSKSSAYANNLGRMRTLGLIDYPGPGRVVATDLLFPEGLS